jgi:LAO/AO transport system kinase
MSEDVRGLVEQVLAGERRAVARAISLVEDGDPELESLSSGIFSATGRAATIGLTGAPGVGKSTLAGALVAVGRAEGQRMAVLAVDPTSPITGGALLGDRVRMQEHATDPGVFIRSMATRGHLGGMALAAPEAVRILDAAGYERVIVETVGVGQAEIDVAAATDTAVVVLAPGSGDAVQLAKAGILEVADIFVVNQADRDGAPALVREVREMLHLGERRDPQPAIVSTTATESAGVEELWAAIEAHRAQLRDSGGLDRRRRARILQEVERLAAERFRLALRAAVDAEREVADGLASGDLDPYAAAARLVAGAVRREATGEPP